MNRVGVLIMTLVAMMSLNSYQFGFCEESAIIQSYRQAIKANPDDVIAHYNLGLSLYQQGKLDEARKMLEKSIKLNPRDKVAHTQVDGLAYQLLGSIYFTSLNKPRLAIASFEKSIKLLPRDAETHYLLGLAYMNEGMNDKAVVTLEQACKLGAGIDGQKNNVYDAYLQLGRLYAENKKSVKAEKAYLSALDINPEGKEVLANLALLYHQQQKSDETVSLLEKLIKLEPMHFNANYLLGLHYFNKKQYDKMEEAYKRAIAIKPDLAEAHYNLGMAYFLQTRYSEAIAALKKVVELNPKDGDAYNLLGQSQQHAIETYLQQGTTMLAQEKWLQALKAFDQVLAIDPRHHKANVYLEDAKRKLKRQLGQSLDEADQKLKKGEVVAAYHLYEKALTLDPDSAEAQAGIKKAKVKLSNLLENYMEKGRAAEKIGDYDEAMLQYNHALKQKQSYQPARQALERLEAVLNTKVKRQVELAESEIGKNKLNKAVSRLEQTLKLAKQIDNKTGKKQVIYLLARANSKKKELIDSYINLGKQAFESGHKSQAKKYFNSVLDVEPQNQMANQFIMKLTGTKSEAKMAAERIKATYYRGVDYYVNGQIEEAIAEWEEVVKLDPDNDDAKVNIKRAKIKLEAIRKLTGNQ